MIRIIKAKSEAFFEDTVRIRRHLHQNPELSFKEEQTAKFVQDQLDSMGIPYQSGIGGHGIVGVIEGHKVSERTIALRADMDALPIQEANEVPYKSQHNGVMHACGHDVHTASLLGAARIINDMRDQFGGQIKLIFQPAEERLPGGASLMIKEGVLEKPMVTSILGQHVHPPLEVGKLGFKAGEYMASADEIYITIHGKGGHGALPHDCVDPITIAAQLINALQQVVSRKSNPTTASVLTFGKIFSDGGATNVIPNAVKLEGTFRTMNEEWRKEAHQWIHQITTNTVEALGGHAEINLVKGYPFLINNEKLTYRVKQWAVEFLGADQVVDLPIRMTAEDFAYYSQEVPAVFYRLGTGNPAKGITSPVHSDTFDVDESCLLPSIGFMAYAAIQQLL